TYARNRLSAAYALPLLIAIVGATATLWIDAWQAVAWGMVAFAIHVAVLLLCRHFDGLQIADVAIRQWTARFVAAAFVGALSWVAILFLARHTPFPGSGLEVFQFATMLIVTSVATMLASTVPSAAVAGSVPVTLTLVGLFIARGDLLFV